MAKTALILGVTGQDGAYLARLLLQRGYTVHGTSRDLEYRHLGGLEHLGIVDDVVLHSVSPTEFRDLIEILQRTAPDEIYNLAGQSSVALSFSQPHEAFNSIAVAQLQLLEVMRHLGATSRVFYACSAECFGSVPLGSKVNESSAFSPVSPYGVAKSSAFWTTVTYRRTYGIHCCSGILFNHESPLRPARFVTRKILRAALDISRGASTSLSLGKLDVCRDWGYADDYVDAMHRMLQLDKPTDLVLATGVAHSLEQFVEAVFERFDLPWRDHVINDPSLHRPFDIDYLCGDPSRAETLLGWKAQTSFSQLVDLLVDAETRA